MQTQNNTHVVAGNTLTLESGHDTNIKGGVASARQVIADVGTSGKGNLSIESLQDTSNYQSKDQSIGGSVTIGYGFAASGNYNQTKVNGSFASVGEQSGIAAGDGGFQIKVNGNTDLKGGVIASSDKAIQDNKNSLSTQTLTQVDIKNHSDFDASGFGVSGGFGVGGDKGDSKAADGSSSAPATIGGQKLQTIQSGSTGTSAGIGCASGSSSSTTRSGISGGVVTITDDAAQQAKTGATATQTVAGINRDVSTAKDSSGALTKDWDGQKLKDDVSAQVQITSTFGQLAAKNIGDYADKKQKEAIKNGDEAEAAKWAEGGAYRVALHTATGALAGGLGGAAGAFTSATAMNVIGDEINKMDLPKDLKQGLAQIAATALGAAIGGAAGAASGLNVDANNRQLHPDEVKFLHDKDRINRYIQYVADQTGRVLSFDEAGRELDRSGAAMDDAHWTALNGRNGIAEKFIVQEAKVSGQFYLDSDGTKHDFFKATKQEYLNETINLRPLFSAYGDNTDVRKYLANNFDESRLNNWATRYRSGQEVGLKDAGMASLLDDVKTLGKGLWNLPSSAWATVTNGDTGIYKTQQMEAYYASLLKLQGRAEEAGYMSEFNWATQQRLAIEGLALGELGGKIGGTALGKLKGALKDSLKGDGAATNKGGAGSNQIVGDEPYAGPNGLSDGGMAHPVKDGAANTANSAPNLPKGYVANADGTFTGPGGGSLNLAGVASDGATPVFQRSGGQYFTIDSTGKQVPVLRTDASNGVTWANSEVGSSQIAQNWANGRKFQNALNQATGLPENTTPVTVTLPGGAKVTTIPDNLGRPAGIVEAKDVINLSMDDQLRAQLQYSTQTGIPYTLVVSTANQTISATLWAAIEKAGGAVYRFDSATQKLTPILNRPH